MPVLGSSMNAGCHLHPELMMCCPAVSDASDKGFSPFHWCYSWQSNESPVRYQSSTASRLSPDLLTSLERLQVSSLCIKNTCMATLLLKLTVVMHS